MDLPKALRQNADEVTGVAQREEWVRVLERAIEAATVALPDDVVHALRAALQRETSDLARLQLETILEDERVARENGLPICQDTGTPVFVVRAGSRSPWLAELAELLVKAVRVAADAIPLRPSAVHPFTDRNLGNVGPGVPVVDWELAPGDDLDITYVAKGGGSENASGLLFVQPGAGRDAILQAVLEHVVRVAPRACPPVVVGVGIGGTSDSALRGAKRALVRRLDAHHEDPDIAAFESELLTAINASGIGPSGLGGATTALAVHADLIARHPASLPVGVALQCWADRRATVRIRADGVAEVVT